MDHDREFDIAVIGGGIHGVSMAAEAASRGLSTILIHGSDLASGASAKFKQVLGGDLNKLENFDLAKVTSNLNELSQLFRRAPHLIQPVPVNIVPDTSIRSKRQVSIGLMLYKFLSPKWIKNTDKIIPTHNSPSNYHVTYETAVNASRLIIGLARAAQSFGAEVLSHHMLSGAVRGKDDWQLTALNNKNNTKQNYSAKIVINCTGWLSDNVLNEILKVRSRCQANVVHTLQIYVKKEDHGFTGSFLLQQDQRRLTYVYPFDEQHICFEPIVVNSESKDDQNNAVNEILNLWNNKFSDSLTKSDITYTKSAKRAVLDDPSNNSANSLRDALVDLNNPGNEAPLLSVFGIDFIQHRKIAQQSFEILKPFTQAKENSNFSGSALPGGNLQDYGEYLRQSSAKYKWIPRSLLNRLIANYGTDIDTLLLDCSELSDLGIHFGHELYQAEIDFLLEHEWAYDVEDILFRRTMLGLYMNNDQTLNLDEYIKSKLD